MKISISQLFNINQALDGILDQKIKNVEVAYKLYKTKAKLEEVLLPVQKSAQKLGKSDAEGWTELLTKEEEIDIEPLKLEDLSEFELSVRDIAAFDKLLESEE